MSYRHRRPINDFKLSLFFSVFFVSSIIRVILVVSSPYFMFFGNSVIFEKMSCFIWVHIYLEMYNIRILLVNDDIYGLQKMVLEIDMNFCGTLELFSVTLYSVVDLTFS